MDSYFGERTGLTKNEYNVKSIKDSEMVYRIIDNKKRL
jgi:hypothetical protein